MTRIAYLDCVSGISGDMLLGAMLDAGLDPDELRRELAGLGIDGAWALEPERTTRAGIAATRAHVRLTEAPQPHRRLPDVLAIIEQARLPDADRASAAAVFRRLADAEARVHGTPADEVDFHEVGALDAIIDVVGGVVGLRLLGIEALYCSPLPAGTGSVRAAHGRLPVPAPATLELMVMAGAPLAASDADRPMELVTPTGAALATVLATFSRPAMRLERVGIGAGGRDPEGWPNVLRFWLGAADEVAALPVMTLLETNIDDMNPEILAYAQERLLAAGAADVWVQPIGMKKNRAGVLLSVLCSPERERELAALLMRETSTLGVRVRDVRRHEAPREVLEFTSSLGAAAVKVRRQPGEPPAVAPEYEACRLLALAHGMPLRDVYRVVEREALALLGRGD